MTAFKTPRTGIPQLTIPMVRCYPIPVPPLDGSRVLEAFLPFRYLRYYYWLERYGMIILLVLLMTGIVDVLFNPIFSLLWGLLPFGFPS